VLKFSGQANADAARRGNKASGGIIPQRSAYDDASGLSEGMYVCTRHGDHGGDGRVDGLRVFGVDFALHRFQDASDR
jgi:hypothetical protein